MRLSLLAASVAAVAAQGGPQLTLQACSAAQASVQQWAIVGKNITLQAQQNGATMCMDISDFSTNVNATVWTWPCGTGGESSNAYWNVTGNSIVSLDGGGKCLRAGFTSQTTVQPGIVVTTAVCDSSDSQQYFVFDASSGHFVHQPSGMCIDAGAPTNWCSMPPQNGWPICNQDLSLDARAADIVSRLSLADKFSALGTSTPSLSSVGLPSYNWWSEATHGISHVRYDNRAPYASNTALPITTSCAFNRSLWAATGNLIGREARAFQNLGLAYSTYWAPVINIVRDPRWGRNLECAGEDPLLSGQYAVNFVKGFEHAQEAPYPLQASACCKHFVANELDGWNGTDRNHIDVFVPQRDLVDSYLPSFQACVTEGQVSSIMCSYNAVNGVPSCANDWLLGTLLRDTWQFDGYVTSDCDADSDVFFSHHYTNTTEEAVAAIVGAGTDVDCGGFMTQYAPGALTAGAVTEAQLDVLLTRLFRVRIRLGNFDANLGPLASIGADQVCTPYGLELARDGARQGAVLVKNDANTLPLNPASYKSAVVIGPNGQIQDTIEYYAGEPCFKSNATAVDAVSQFIAATSFVAGVPDVGSDDTSGVAAAAAAAAGADLVVLALGSDLMLEREGHDRTAIAFSGGQLALITAVAAAAKGPVVALVFSGGAMDVSPLLSNTGVHAVVHMGQPSVQVVGAGDVIFGRTPAGVPVAPAGRMSQTTYSADYVNQVSMFDFGMRPGPSAWPPGTNPGRTYRFFTGTPVLPFGYGLSYTTWKYTPLPDPAPPVDLSHVRATLATEEGSTFGHIAAGLHTAAADFWVNVTNTGTVDSDEVVLGFLVPPGAGTDGTPLQELFGFERVHVRAGETVTVYLGAQGRFFTQADDAGVRRALPGKYKVRFGVAETAARGMGFAEFEVLAH